MTAAPRLTRSADIVGVGPAGMLMALALARRGWDIRLISQSRQRPHNSRIDVLGKSAIPTLARLGISPEELPHVAKQCPGTWFWWETTPHWHDSLTGPHGLSWAVDRASFDVLLHRPMSAAGVQQVSDPIPPSSQRSLQSSRRREDSPWIIFASGSTHSPHDSKHAAASDDQLIA
ncbi:FAD-dependent monooxygenase [Rhizobium leguminosarum]|uniref:NAD(P)/FAD-dependent oxidoreductase n=1 Tax=Rhizobium leguminosarum TaxID=384 RepID=UPI003ED0FAA2